MLDQKRKTQNRHFIAQNQTDLHAITQQSLCLFLLLLVSVFCLCQTLSDSTRQYVISAEPCRYSFWYLATIRPLCTSKCGCLCATDANTSCQLINRIVWQNRMEPNAKRPKWQEFETRWLFGWGKMDLMSLKSRFMTSREDVSANTPNYCH